MKVGYFDCFAGASGDMILAALLDAGLEPRALVEGLAGLGIRDLEVKASEVSRHGVRAKSFGFTAAAGPKGGSFGEIKEVLEAANLAPSVKAGALRAFTLLADAEGRIHGKPADRVHFHEVGSLDALVDVVGAFIGLEALGIKQVVSSPLALGEGSIQCAHGTLPSPAPATVEIARGLPVRGWALDGELTTPTGAAILKAAASAFGPVPAMTVTAVGYGAGTRDLAAIPNVLRLMVGDAPDLPSLSDLPGLPGAPGQQGLPAGIGTGLESDRVTLLETNIDDMNPQFFSHIFDDLFARGALDVWVESILMKKGRPGFRLSVLAQAAQVPALAAAVLAETTTSGVRLQELSRLKLPRRIVEVETRFGRIRIKVFAGGAAGGAAAGPGAPGERSAPEYDDCVRCARAHKVTVSEVMEEARDAFRKMRRPGDRQ